MTEMLSHPDYAAGFEAGWRGRGAKTGSAPYLAGHRAGLRFRELLEEKGFVLGEDGDYTMTGIVSADDMPKLQKEQET